MTKRYLPSVEALTDSDEGRLIAELKLSEVREQLAHAASLIEDIDRLVPLSDDHEPSADGHAVLKELATLGCKIVEIASVLSRRAAGVST